MQSQKHVDDTESDGDNDDFQTTSPKTSAVSPKGKKEDGGKKEGGAKKYAVGRKRGKDKKCTTVAGSGTTDDGDFKDRPVSKKSKKNAHDKAQNSICNFFPKVLLLLQLLLLCSE